MFTEQSSETNRLQTRRPGALARHSESGSRHPACYHLVHCLPREELWWSHKKHSSASFPTAFWCTAAHFGKPAPVYSIHFAVASSLHIVRHRPLHHRSRKVLSAVRRTSNNFHPRVLSPTNFLLLWEKSRQFPADGTKLSFSHHLLPFHTVTHPLFSLFFFTLFFHQRDISPTQMTTATHLPCCLLLPSAVVRILRHLFPAAPSHQAHRALAHVFLEFLFCSLAHKAHWLDEYDQPPLPCARGTPGYSPPSPTSPWRFGPPTETAASHLKSNAALQDDAYCATAVHRAQEYSRLVLLCFQQSTASCYYLRPAERHNHPRSYLSQTPPLRRLFASGADLFSYIFSANFIISSFSIDHRPKIK